MVNEQINYQTGYQAGIYFRITFSTREDSCLAVLPAMAMENGEYSHRKSTLLITDNSCIPISWPCLMPCNGNTTTNNSDN